MFVNSKAQIFIVVLFINVRIRTLECSGYAFLGNELNEVPYFVHWS